MNEDFPELPQDLPNIQELLQQLEDNFVVPDEPIDLDTQLAYFRLSKKLRKKQKLSDVISNKDKLFDPEVPIQDKKELLALLGGFGNPEVYRTLQDFANTAEPELQEWVKIALLESKSTMEGELLDKPKVILSTGLGGKDGKLRFLAVIYHEDLNIKDYQEKLMRDVINDRLTENDCILEQLEVCVMFTKITFLSSFRQNIAAIFREAITECNEYGNFLSPEFMLTNSKQFTEDELIEVYEKHNKHKFGEDKEEDKDSPLEDIFPPVE